MDAINLIAAALSVLATVSTFYFWLVRGNRERPHLRAYLVSGPSDFAWNRDRDGGVYFLAYLRLALANYSALPNALIHCQFSVMSKEGAWLPLTMAPRWNNVPSFELPMNIPSLQTMPLNAWLQLNGPAGAVEEGSGFLRYVAKPIQVKVELIGLARKKFTEVITAAS